MSGRGALSWVVAALVVLVTWAPTARADIFRLTYDESAADPAEGFDEACLAGSPAEDCDARAALIEAELIALLSRLDSDREPETLELFRAALELDSPVVQAMAARYVSRANERPTGFFSKVRTFFWGPDAPRGVTASEVLKTSSVEGDARLAELFGEQRSESDYAPDSVFSERASTDEQALADNRLLQACSKDARLELMPSFAEEEVFEPARRLLIYDRFVWSTLDPNVSYPATAFLTDARVEDVSQFFSKTWGEPIGPVGESQARMEELTEQLVELQNAAAGGDREAIAEIGRIAEELADLQEVVTLAALLQLDALHAENDVIFLDGTPEDLLTEPKRAVTVGKDDVAGGTVIRYINAPNGAGKPGGGGDGKGGGPGDAEEPVGGGGNDEPRSKRSDDGCGCSVPGQSSPYAGLAALPLLAWLIRRVRRAR